MFVSLCILCNEQQRGGLGVEIQYVCINPPLCNGFDSTDCMYMNVIMVRILIDIVVCVLLIADFKKDPYLL